MKSIHLVILFIFLFPLFVFAEKSNVSFSPSDTMLQGQSTVIYETSNYYITIPKDWTYYSITNKENRKIDVYNTSPQNVGINIYNRPLEPNENYDDFLDIYVGSFVYKSDITNKKIDVVDADCIRLTSYIPNESRYAAAYVLKKNNIIFMIICRMSKHNYDQDLIMCDEIVKTIELKTYNIQNVYQFALPISWRAYPAYDKSSVAYYAISPEKTCNVLFDRWFYSKESSFKTDVENLEKNDPLLIKNTLVEREKIKIDGRDAIYSLYSNKDKKYEIRYYIDNHPLLFIIWIKGNYNNLEQNRKVISEILSGFKVIN